MQKVFRDVAALQVTVLEAQGHVGGRVHDDTSLGPCVPLGAMIVTGICSNPITILCKQVNSVCGVCMHTHASLQLNILFNLLYYPCISCECWKFLS